MSIFARISRVFVANGTQMCSRHARGTIMKSGLNRHIHRSALCCGVIKEGEEPLELSNAEWARRLQSEQFYVCREKGTELPFAGKYVHNYEKGTYNCVCCGTSLFSSESKFQSRTGWPSFWAAHKEGEQSNILRRRDYSEGMTRIQVACMECDAHLGHVFDDGPQPTGERFCINSAALEFVAEDTSS